MRTLVLLLTIITFISSTAKAETWSFNPNHSQVRFSVPFMGVSTVEGSIDKFRLESEELSIGENKARWNSAELVLLVSGLSTGVAQRDRHLKGPDFFYSSLHPRFVVKVAAADLDMGMVKEVKTQVTLKDVTNEVKAEFKYLGIRTNKNNQRSAFFEVKAKISRQSFGLGWNQYLTQNEMLLGDEIAITSHFEFNPIGEKPAISEFYKLSKEERVKFMKDGQADSQEFDGPSTKEVLILESKVSTLTTEVEALSQSNQILRQELSLAREGIPQKIQDQMPAFARWASAAVFFITIIFGFSVGVWIKWKLIAPLKMEDKAYVKLDRLTDGMLMILVLCGVGVMSWFFGLF